MSRILGFYLGHGCFQFTVDFYEGMMKAYMLVKHPGPHDMGCGYQ